MRRVLRRRVRTRPLFRTLAAMIDPALHVTLAAAPEVVTLLEPAAVLAAVCDPTRHTILCLLADGQPRSVNDLAARMDRPADAISKHLRVLRDARLIRGVAVPGTDRRRQFHELSVLFRSRDTAGKTVLDFGAIVLRPE